MARALGQPAEPHARDMHVWIAVPYTPALGKGTPSVFSPFNRPCDGAHTHADTAISMPACPPNLRQAYAACLAAELRSRAAILPVDIPSVKANPRRIMRSEQHRLPQLISEFGLITDVPPTTYDCKLIVPPPLLFQGGVDSSSICKKYDSSGFLQLCEPFTILCFERPPDANEQVYGVYRKPEEFLQCALKVNHPIDVVCPLPDLLIDSIAKVLEWGPAKLIKHRAAMCKYLLTLPAQTKQQDLDMLKKAAPFARKVLQGKRLALWKRLSQEFDCPETAIIDEMVEGIRLVGLGTESKLFPSGYQIASTTPDELRKQSKWIRHHVVGKCRGSHDLEADRACWSQTVDEVSKGWMVGPMSSIDEVSEMLGSDLWLCSRRG